MKKLITIILLSMLLNSCGEDIVKSGEQNELEDTTVLASAPSEVDIIKEQGKIDNASEFNLDLIKEELAASVDYLTILNNEVVYVEDVEGLPLDYFAVEMVESWKTKSDGGSIQYNFIINIDQYNLELQFRFNDIFSKGNKIREVR